MSDGHASAAPDRVGGRFERGAPLGAGGQGRVFEAIDALTGEEAVIKWVAHPSARARLQSRAEVAGLRGLSVPGVARLLDAGEEPDALWLAMARVRGLPFPGLLPPSWTALAPCVEAMLGALAAVHRVGLVHRDLKPGNLLVTASGQPVIVDFGLAGAAGRRPGGQGTRRYMAPEQAAGEEVDPRADLHAVGKLLLEVLDADPELPHGVLQALRAMISEDPEDRPASASEALRALGIDGRERAQRALDAILPALDPIPLNRLGELFVGHERVLRARSEGARALWRRTGGRRERLVEVLAAWVREGLARAEQGRFALAEGAAQALETVAWPSGEGKVEGLDPRAAAWLPWLNLMASDARLDRLQALWPEAALPAHEALPRLEAQGAVLLDGDTPRVLAWPQGFRARLLPVTRAEAARRVAALLPVGERLRYLVIAGEDPVIVAREAAEVAERQIQEGRPAAAISTLELALPALRQNPGESGEEEARLHRLWARAALSLARPRDLDRALFELERGAGRDAAIAALLHGARRSLDGDGAGALRILEDLQEFPDEDLEIWRAAMSVHASRRCAPPRVEEVLDRLKPWAEGRTARQAALAGWWGILRYQQERYEEAAALHERSAEGKTVKSAQRSSWLNAAYAWLELGELARAEALAEAVRRGAAESRHALQELEAERVRRAAQLRQPGAEVRYAPDLELVEVSFAVGSPAIGAVTSLAEAALALRRGDAEGTRALATRARRGFRVEHMADPALLCRALALAYWPDEAAAAAVIHEAETCATPGLAVQAAALAVWSGGSAPLLAAAREVFARRAPEVRAPPEVVQEVLSLKEAAARLGVEAPGTVHA